MITGTGFFDLLVDEWSIDLLGIVEAELQIIASFTQEYDVQLAYTPDRALQINIDTEHIYLTMNVYRDGHAMVYVGRGNDILVETEEWADRLSTVAKYFYLFCFTDIEICDNMD